jgi:hypothetical protein
MVDGIGEGGVSQRGVHPRPDGVARYARVLQAEGHVAPDGVGDEAGQRVL